MDNKKDALNKIKGYENVLIYKDCYFKDFNTFQINNLIETMIIPKDVYALKKIIFDLNQYEIDYLVIGNGSKVLFKHFYVKKVIILLNYNLSQLTFDNQLIYATAGVNLSKLIAFSHQHHVGGIEKLIGIPACVGGAIYKNASAHNCQLSDYIVKVDYIDENGNFMTIDKEKCDFQYRHSIFQKRKKWTIVGSLFSFPSIDVEQKKEEMKQWLAYRKNAQPVNYKNCGSVFKNPYPYHAYQLIESCNLKSKSIGGAMIAPEHANFIVNFNQAKPKDILQLIELIQQEVYQKYQIKLELELEIFD